MAYDRRHRHKTVSSRIDGRQSSARPTAMRCGGWPTPAAVRGSCCSGRCSSRCHRRESPASSKSAPRVSRAERLGNRNRRILRGTGKVLNHVGPWLSKAIDVDNHYSRTGRCFYYPASGQEFRRRGVQMFSDGRHTQAGLSATGSPLRPQPTISTRIIEPGCLDLFSAVRFPKASTRRR